MSTRTAAQLYRYSCITSGEDTMSGESSPVGIKNPPPVNSKSYVGGRNSPAAIALCPRTLMPTSGKRIKKTRKYDIITTPAERVEMAPLNEDDDDDEDSTVFDVKYRY
ncbi:hypothetical protein UY3_07611 [Chelonia mydas]|uniref:Membrane protein FAM174B n=1 Tax=Chelonia mydas TaxID=8469 RepID=M7C459_CHEMY|nr:hypothetical protein UY3_07611 [Chelonia mydas]